MPVSLRVRYASGTLESHVRVAPGGLDRLGAFARRVAPAKRALLVTDTRVGALYGRRAVRSLERAGYRVFPLTLPAGERTKRAAMLERVWRTAAAGGLTRREPIVALGGGVIGDLAGFAAATWLRGVPWVGVPTSLLSQVDSSVGGKTGIDLPEGKNLVGAFHQPAGVLVDPALLETLTRRHFRAGLAEVVKVAMACDGGLFRWLERHAEPLAARDRTALSRAIERAIRAKGRVVMADEREREGGGRSALNFGHTLAHALEAAHGYRGLLHGEAVAIGTRFAAGLSVPLAGLDSGERRRLDQLLDAFGLPKRMPATSLGALTRAMNLDKKRTRAGVRWVLTPRIGFASVPRLIPGRLVRAALREAGARG